MEEIVLSPQEKTLLAAIMATCFPAISPEFKNLPLITGTAGEFKGGAEAEKWFYSVPCEKFDYSTLPEDKIKENKYE